ncbi:MAG: 50S ribosomal protein L13 [Muribaculaceae bacterium]|nr:50S ribosomal protein L13 [Muribaculaceae bacterium]
MDTLSYKTLTPNAQEVKREWVVIDATDQHLGRLCSKVAKILRGKNKPSYSPFVECGDYVIIVNAEKIVLTGKKMTDRIYYSYTGYPGGQREATAETLLKKSFNKHLKAGKHPLFLHVMKGMLPKNRLGRKIINNLFVYNGPNHPHEAQAPKVLDINSIK